MARMESKMPEAAHSNSTEHRREHWRVPELVRVHGPSKGWWYARIAAGELAAIRLGGIVLVPDSEVRRLLAAATPARAGR
jgi:predicted DNA-binding transcriptional regulator AlpA